jgi:ferric-dicitrate binding protein FerR (iron transport regulator)
MCVNTSLSLGGPWRQITSACKMYEWRSLSHLRHCFSLKSKQTTAMLNHPRCKTILAAFLFMFVVPVAPAIAQTIPGCMPRQATNPARTVFECQGGLTIEAEAAARLGLGQASSRGGGAPTELSLEGGAALFELQPGGVKNFQIRTPHAIASVRGTTYAVNALADKTEVFVMEGRVRVTRDTGGRAVTLSRGEGIEVTPGKRLRSGRWSAARRAALLARFGR